jgi:hypothetical protein
VAITDEKKTGVGVAQAIRAVSGIEEPMDPAEALISKAADELEGQVVDPMATLTGALSKLTETFEKETGRRPGEGDTGFWESVGKVYGKWVAALERGGTR